MRQLLGSLRGRLVAGMLLMFALRLGGAFLLEPIARRAQAGSGMESIIFQDPYQDVLMLVPFSLGAIALLWLVSGWSLRHLASASREAAIVGPGNPGARISTARLPEEIRPLVSAINGALDRLADAYQAEQRFVADAAHELRTPLAVLSLHLQRAKLGGELDWATIDQDIAQLSKLVDQLLDLARKEHERQTGGSGERPIVNLSRVAREAAAAVFPLVNRSQRQLDVDLPDDLPVRGRASELHDMIRNLLDNALVHGEGRICLSGGIERDEAVIAIADDGPGVLPSLRERVFERFTKAPAGGEGHGLGLAIVREIVRAHGGDVAFAPGQVATIRATFPLARPA